MTSSSTSHKATSDNVSSEFAAFRSVIDTKILSDLKDFLFAVGANGLPLEPLAFRAVEGGKRLRALCAYSGAASLIDAKEVDLVSEVPGLAELGTALEFYQASALVHDDVIDNSPTRRGLPSSHIALASEHRDSQLVGSPEEYGANAAVLLGNLLTAAAESSLAQVLAVTNQSNSAALVFQYAKMTGEVAQGQFRDMAAGYDTLEGLGSNHRDPVGRAMEIIRVKSALYSVVRPAQLGAILAGATPQQVQVLEDVLVPAGLAFQLRDDSLGAFGDEMATGKSSQSDIRERKRTVLLALTYANADEAARSVLERVYGSETVSDEDVAEVASILAKYGHPAHEDLISQLVRDSRAGLAQAELTTGARDKISHLVELLTNRVV